MYAATKLNEVIGGPEALIQADSNCLLIKSGKHCIVLLILVAKVLNL
jgi:hypothetical protein